MRISVCPSVSDPLAACEVRVSPPRALRRGGRFKGSRAVGAEGRGVGDVTA